MRGGRVLFIIAAVTLFLSIIPQESESDNRILRGDLTFSKSIEEIIADSLSRGEGICTVVGDIVKAGGDVAETVEKAIQMGHPACVVVRCAIEAGGKLEDVITSAFRAGASSDVIVSCCVEGGADTDAIARTIERLALPGLGYTPPPATYVVYTPTFNPTIGDGGGGGGSVSPFRP